MTTLPAPLSVARVAGHIGAIVTGVDLTADLAPSVVAGIRAALLEHKVVFFRDQHSLDHAGQIAFTARFGQVTRRARPQSDDETLPFPEILTVSPHIDLDAYGLDYEKHYRSRLHHGIGAWHSDMSHTVNPPAGSVLRAGQLPSRGGDTQWTNLEAAYDGLPESLQNMLAHLQAEHTFAAGYDMSPYDPIDRIVLDRVSIDPMVAVHPVVRVHPETGRRALFVSPARVRRIIGLTPMESRQLLDLLFREVTRPEYTVRFTWRPGDVAFWDNASTAHIGPADAPDDEPRVMYRVTLLGGRPVGPDGFTSYPLAGPELTACPSPHGSR